MVKEWKRKHPSLCVAGLIHALSLFKSGMCELNVGSKEVCDFSNVVAIGTKFCGAKRTFVIARESPVTILGCHEVYVFPHAQRVYAEL